MISFFLNSSKPILVKPIAHIYKNVHITGFKNLPKKKPNLIQALLGYLNVSGKISDNNAVSIKSQKNIDNVNLYNVKCIIRKIKANKRPKPLFDERILVICKILYNCVEELF